MRVLQHAKTRILYHTRKFAIRLTIQNLKLQTRLLKGLQEEQYHRYLTKEEIEVSSLLAQTHQILQGVTFHASIARAISSWSNIETIMVFIFTLISKCESDVAGIVLYSGSSTHYWIQVITEIFALRPEQKKNLKQWNSMASELRRLKELRDRLAHNTTMDASATSSSVLLPGSFDARSKSKKYPPLAEADILVFEHDLMNFTSKIIDFCENVRGVALASAQKSLSPTDDPHPALDAPEHPTPTGQ